MAIKISDIPAEGLTLEIDDKLMLSDMGTASTDVRAVLSIRPTGNGMFRVKGHIQASPLLECSRCLKKFPYPVNTEPSFELVPISVMGTAPEQELGKGDLDIEFYPGDEIEPNDLVREQLLIAVPMVPLHDPECKGLCSICGKDRNEEECDCQQNLPNASGAFSALKDLLKN